MDQAEEVKSKLDIVAVISGYIPLKRAGRNFSALCPFHAEKTPSFMVSDERQVYKCFGCGEGGDVFSFVEKMEGWDFRETLEELAKKAGVKLTSFAPTQTSKLKDKIVEVNKLAVKFYSHILNKHKLGEPARKYLEKRGVKREMWEKFSLGFAPEGWEHLGSFLAKRKFTLDEVAASGLIVSREGANKGSFYDRFRSRIMFPIENTKGTIVGFSGRILDENQKEAKYVNTPETAIFHKGSILYGLTVAKQAIREKNFAILVEGEFDVISLHQTGITNVVASKGTALTEKQVATLANICANVALCFDMDIAGDAAARRGIEMLDMAGVNVKVVDLGKFKDPDEFAKSDPKGLKGAIGRAQNVFDWLIESAAKRYQITTSEGKRDFGREIIPTLGKITDEVMRAHYVTKVARLLDIEPTLVAEAVSNKAPQLYMDSSNLDAKVKAAITLEDYFLALYLALKSTDKQILTLVAPDDFEGQEAGKLWGFVSSHAIIKTSKADFFSSLPEALDSFVDHLSLIALRPEFNEPELLVEEIVKVGVRIRELSIRRQMDMLSKQLSQAQKEANMKKVEKLAREFDLLSTRFKEVLKNA